MGLFTKKKKNNYYYESFSRLCHYAVLCGETILSFFESFNSEGIAACKKSVHELEHQGDCAKHEVTAKLTLEFMTPIDREDILSLLRMIDNVTDAVEEISLKLYIYDYKELPKDSIPFMKLIVDCIKKTEECLVHFNEFEDSKVILPYIKQVIELEEKSDDIYEADMRELYVNEKDPLKIRKAETIYTLLEETADSCREVCKFVETIMFKNL